MRDAINDQIVARRIVMTDPADLNVLGDRVAFAALINLPYQRFGKCALTPDQNAYSFHFPQSFLMFTSAKDA